MTLNNELKPETGKKNPPKSQNNLKTKPKPIIEKMFKEPVECDDPSLAPLDEFSLYDLDGGRKDSDTESTEEVPIGHFTLNIPQEPEPYITDVLQIEPAMKDWFHEESPPHPFYIQYRMFQAKHLNASTRKYLSMHLNPAVDVGFSEAGYQQDWKGLADLMGKCHQFTHSLERFKDPTGELLLTWQTEQGSTIAKLLSYLRKMDRFDILEDLKFMDLIKESCKNSDLLREKELRRIAAEKRSSNIVVDDVGNEKKAMFDAFVCFSDDDYEFMIMMMKELEEQRGYKLCLDVRDLLDHKDHSITAEVIKERCKRSIVILSKNFVREDNKLCEFAMRVAQSLSPAASRSKIIPILIDDATVPTSLGHLTLVDYTRQFQRRFMWKKIAATMEDTASQLYLVEQEKLRHVSLESSDEGANKRQVVLDRHGMMMEELRQKQRENHEEEEEESKKSESSSSSPNSVGIAVVPPSSTTSLDSLCPRSLSGKKHSDKLKTSLRGFFFKRRAKKE